MGTQTRFPAPEQDFIPRTLNKRQVRELPYFIYRELGVNERPPLFPTDEPLWSDPMPSVFGMTTWSPLAEPATVTPAFGGQPPLGQEFLNALGKGVVPVWFGEAEQAACGRTTPVSH